MTETEGTVILLNKLVCGAQGHDSMWKIHKEEINILFHAGAGFYINPYGNSRFHNTWSILMPKSGFELLEYLAGVSLWIAKKLAEPIGD